MNLRIKLTAAALLAAMSLTTFAACSSSDSGNTPDAGTTAANGGEAAAETTTEFRYTTDLEERDLGGFKMTVIQRSEEDSPNFYEPGFYTAEQSGDMVRDEIYNRNMLLTEKYNFTVEEIANESRDTVDSKIISTVLAGDDTYDVVVMGPNYFAKYMQQGLVIDLNTLDNFNFDAEWWYSDLNAGLSVDNFLPMTVGAHMLHCKNGLYMLLFNKNLAKDYGVDSNALYQKVRDGQWTADEMIATVNKVASKDLNGDGNIDHNDLYSFGTENYGIHTLTLGSGFLIASKDKDDIPTITMYNENNVEILNKYMQLFGDHNKTCVTQAIKGVDSVWTTATNMWKNGQMFMRMSDLGDGMREIEYDYGVLPIPKYTESQDEYYHTASIWNAPVMGIPKTCSDADKTSYICEIMACESLNGLTDIFYENYLTTKLVRDDESIEMLKIVHGSLYFDVGSVFNWNSMLNILYTISQSGENNFASAYESKASGAEQALQKSLDAIAAAN